VLLVQVYQRTHRSHQTFSDSPIGDNLTDQHRIQKL